MKFPKHKNERPDQTVRPTMLCLYAFFLIDVSSSFRPRKSWKSLTIDWVMEKKQSKQVARLHARACVCGWNPMGQEAWVCPWHQFSFWQLVSSFKTELGRACNVKFVFDWSHRWVWRGGQVVVAPYLNRIEIGANYHARMSMSKSMQLSKHMTKHKQYNPAV